MSKTMMFLVFAAAACNIVTVYCLKTCKGMTLFLPTVGVVVSILVCHWFLARAIEGGGQVGLAVAGNVVIVMMAAALIGWSQFGEKPTTGQFVGYALAAVGVIVASVAAGPVESRPAP